MYCIIYLKGGGLISGQFGPITIIRQSKNKNAPERNNKKNGICQILEQV